MKAAIRGTEIYFDVAGMQLAPHHDDFIERPVLFMLHGGPGGDHLRSNTTRWPFKTSPSWFLSITAAVAAA